MPGIAGIVTRSIIFYKKPVLYQSLIILLLTAVITGSLMTGRSVRESLKKSATERLGNTGILISSGMRFFDVELVHRMKGIAGLNSAGILELNGYSQSLISQKGASNTKIIGIGNDFFRFHGVDTTTLKPGEVAINKSLADYLGIKSGDDIIIRFKTISDIPSDAPFAPVSDAVKSIVMKVGKILEANRNGNFSLSISQIAPLNIFINLADLEENSGLASRINRLLIRRSNNNSINSISESLQQNLKPADIGLRIRSVKRTGENELVSDRIFIDEAIINEISKQFPSSAPVITYLGNRFESAAGSTPYSFVSALPYSLYPEIGSGNEMIINEWIARDLTLEEGDSVKMYWYSPDSLNRLVERGGHFVVKRIVKMDSIWSDSLLMPEFPGISGKTSCSDWDAGVPVKMHEIRPKDEDYWNSYRGTPKAFISYDKGKELWGNIFGPATAIRFPSVLRANEIEAKLEGSLDPFKSGFTVTDLFSESVIAADTGVDFGTLFLGLGFFLILAAMVLLSFITSSYFDSKKPHIKTLYALGFTTRRITLSLFLEVALIGLAGCLTGAFAGYLVDVIVTHALNSVWIGAVQTDTIGAYFNLLPIISGFIFTYLIIILFFIYKVRRYLSSLIHTKTDAVFAPSSGRNQILLFGSLVLTISFFVLSFIFNDQKISFMFATGTLLLLSLLLFWRQYYINRSINNSGSIRNSKQLSHRYYSYDPSGAITPMLFIAAGIFTVFITAVNHMYINENQLERSGGTGGYLLWCENSIPIKEDLNNESVRKTMGLESRQLSELRFVQMKRSSGNDASCLNLNHITAPPLLGTDPADFIEKKSFAFSKVLRSGSITNPWQYLKLPLKNNTIYGIADQTVLDWGLKLKPGDTLEMRAENGQPFRIIIAAGLQPSVFQGNLLIGLENFSKYFPSVSGSSVLLAEGSTSLTDLYKDTLNDRLESSGISIDKTTDRLASFYKVTNTYLSVFGFFGALGMIIGITGLGFVLLRNYNYRKREFALMLACGFHIKMIRLMILTEQVLIFFAGLSSGVIAAIVATLPSIKNNHEIPWSFMIFMSIAIVLTGCSALFISVRSVTKDALVVSLNRD